MLDPVIILLLPLLFIIVVVIPVKFAPLIAGSVPVKFAAGNEVKFAPEPLNDVAVTTPTMFKPSSSPPIVPDPLTCTDIIPPYTTVQVDPLGIVTTTLPASVIGPALMAFFPELIV